MTIRDVGEFGFIKRLKNQLNSDIGDDCAILPYTEGHVLLITTDALVEGIHFLLDKISPYDLGHKAMAVNVSDIAAKGGVPFAATISLSMPKTTTLEWLQEFYRGLQETAESSGAEIVGGDTTGSPGPLFISITVLGKMAKAQVKRRSAAKIGDIVCTTGFVGDSAAGLKALLDGLSSDLIAVHQRPRPHLKEGAFLATFDEVHAMMDLSDGLASDTKRIADESNCQITIDPSKLPLSPTFIKEGWQGDDLGFNGGEDYCLLLTVAAGQFPLVSKAFEEHFNHPLYPIGTVTAVGTPEVICSIKTEGFSHFP